MGQSFYNALIDILVLLYRRSNRTHFASLVRSIWRGIATQVYLLVYKKSHKRARCLVHNRACFSIVTGWAPTQLNQNT
jgi:hypothetical protein